MTTHGKRHRRFADGTGGVVGTTVPALANGFGPIVVAISILTAGTGGATSQLASERRPVAGTSPAVLVADVPGVAWLQERPAALHRVRLAMPPEAPAFDVGPGGPGADGPPVAIAGADEAWIVAARGDGVSSYVWATGRLSGAWAAPHAAPMPQTWNHHPAAALHPDGPWVVWVGDEGGADGATLYASQLAGGAWGPVEELPGAPGTPMAPSIAVDARQRPVVVWAAGDGNDAEIWLSVRDAGRWSVPLRLSDDATPDIAPSIAGGGDELLVAWSAYTPEGYAVVARAGRVERDGGDEPEWSAPTRLGDGGWPRALMTGDGAAVLWAGRTTGARALEAAIRTAGVWERQARLVTTAVSLPAVAAARDGRMAVAWSDADGGLTVHEGEIGRRGLMLPGAAPAAAADSAIVPAVELPRAFTAFGDSITNGVVQFADDRFETPGYRGPLQAMLGNLIGPVSVPNEGRDGETTDEGVGRIDNAVRDTDADAIEIMEGTNDVTFLVDAETTAFNLRRIVERAFEEKEGILVFLGLIPPRNDPGAGFEGAFNRRTDEVNELLPAIAEELGATLVDTHSPFDGRAELFSDRVHPNEDGYGVLGEAWFDGIKPVVLDLTNRGDLDASGRVDGIDLVRLALAFGARAGEPRYSEEADVNGDGIVDGFDLAILAEFFGGAPGGPEGDGS